MKIARITFIALMAFPLLITAQNTEDCTGVYQNNQPHGTWICSFPNDSNQTQLEVVYNEGVVDGLRKEYYANGQLKQSSNYVNGNLQGLTKAYYENGTLKYEGSFTNGQPSGTHKEYNSSGVLINEETF